MDRRFIKSIFKTLAIFQALALAACSKAADQPALDTEAPAIHVIAPLENAIFPKGSLAPITIEFADNLGMHAYYIYMMDESTGQPSLVEKKHIHTKNWKVEQQFLIPEDAIGPFRLDVEAVDHEYNTARMSIPIGVE